MSDGDLADSYRYHILPNEFSLEGLGSHPQLISSPHCLPPDWRSLLARESRSSRGSGGGVVEGGGDAPLSGANTPHSSNPFRRRRKGLLELCAGTEQRDHQAQ